jgi:hypothetical protein
VIAIRHVSYLCNAVNLTRAYFTFFGDFLVNRGFDRGCADCAAVLLQCSPRIPRRMWKFLESNGPSSVGSMVEI